MSWNWPLAKNDWVAYFLWDLDLEVIEIQNHCISSTGFIQMCICEHVLFCFCCLAVWGKPEWSSYMWCVLQLQQEQQKNGRARLLPKSWSPQHMAPYTPPQPDHDVNETLSSSDTSDEDVWTLPPPICLVQPCSSFSRWLRCHSYKTLCGCPDTLHSLPSYILMLIYANSTWRWTLVIDLSTSGSLIHGRQTLFLSSLFHATDLQKKSSSRGRWPLSQSMPAPSCVCFAPDRRQQHIETENEGMLSTFVSTIVLAVLQTWWLLSSLMPVCGFVPSAAYYCRALQVTVSCFFICFSPPPPPPPPPLSFFFFFLVQFFSSSFFFFFFFAKCARKVLSRCVCHLWMWL